MGDESVQRHDLDLEAVVDEEREQHGREILFGAQHPGTIGQARRDQAAHRRHTTDDPDGPRLDANEPPVTGAGPIDVAIERRRVTATCRPILEMRFQHLQGAPRWQAHCRGIQIASASGELGAAHFFEHALQCAAPDHELEKRKHQIVS